MYKLLIVDDESIERNAIQFVIDKSELNVFEIEEASNGQEAIAISAIFCPDIILMDIQMPSLNGLESAKIIKKILPDTKIIFLTAYNQFDYAHEAIKLGVEDFIIKPATNERFISVIQKTIGEIEDFKIQKKNHEEMESKLSQVSKYLEAEFLSSVITGDITKAQADEYFHFNNIDYKAAMGITISMSFDAEIQKSNIQNQIFRKRILSGVEVELNKLVKFYYSSIAKDYIYIMIFGDEVIELMDLQNLIRKIISDLGEYFSSEHQVYIDFGIGDVYEEITHVWKSFVTARKNSNKEVEVFAKGMKEELHNLIQCAQTYDDEHYQHALDRFIDRLNSEMMNIDTLKIKLYEILVLLKEIIEEKMGYVEINMMALFGRVMAMERTNEVRIIIRDFIYQGLTEINEQKKDKTKVVLDKLITYLNAHIQEDITLEQLSHICGLSTFYISKIFKKHLDMNFTDYICLIRIKAAKRMLKNPNLSIKHISVDIGYSDPNYFARVFKKQVGVTPSDYRARHIDVEKDYES